MSDDRKVWRWSQNLNDDGPMWRHGRASITFRERGRLNYAGDAHQDLSFGVAWRLLPKSGFGVGTEVRWGTNASETTPDVAFHAGRLGDLWLHASDLIPRRWLERHKLDRQGQRVTDYDTRVFSINVDTTAFRWEWWARSGSWSRSDPWWMQGRLDYRDFLFGGTIHNSEVTSEGTCVIPMPEHTYPATFKIERAVWTRPRLLGRVRDAVLGPLSAYSVTLTPGEPIPVPGKGENSWDCGDDAIYSSTSPGQSVEQAIASYVESALRTRARYGGEHMSAGARDD